MDDKMNDSNLPEQGYHDNTTGNKPRIPIKTILIVGLCAVVAISAVLILVNHKTQHYDLEEAEPLIEYAGTDSQVAGIQFLIREGLTREQYVDVYEQLSAFAEAKFPNAVYLNYVPESFSLESPASSEEVGHLSAEDDAALLSQIATSAGTDEEPPAAYSEDRTDDGTGSMLMVFKMETDSGESVIVKINPSADFEHASVDVIDITTGKKIN